MHFTIPVIPYTSISGTVAETTTDVFQIPQNVKRASFHLYAGSLYGGTTPTLDVRVQGAPAGSAGWYTSMPCYRTGTAPNSIGGLMAFTQMTTAGRALKYTEFPAPYVRAKYAVGGATVVTKFGLYMTCYED